MSPPFHYLPQIAFQSEQEKQEILSRGLLELKKGTIPQQAIQRGQKYRGLIENSFEPKVAIRYINENVGYGAFAEEPLKARQYIGEYTGIVRENLRNYFAPLNNYCYEYPIPDPIGRSYVIDATQGNFTRFINHSDSPNLKPLYAFLDGFYHLIFLAMRPIAPGEQLSYAYGSRYWYLRSPPEKL